jgi:hypothetical protein
MKRAGFAQWPRRSAVILDERGRSDPPSHEFILQRRIEPASARNFQKLYEDLSKRSRISAISPFPPDIATACVLRAAPPTDPRRELNVG